MLPRRSAIFLGLAGVLLAGIGVFGWDGSKWWRVRVDQNSQSVVSIQEVHHHIHDGDHYFVGGYDSLDNGDTTEFVIDTPATGEVHMEFAYSSNKAYTLELWEGATYTGGTSVDPVNSNRQSTNTAALSVKKNPTTVDTSGATKLLEIAIGTGGRFASATEVADSRENEMVLKQSETYYYKITSNEAGATLTYLGSWYEID